MTIRCLDATHQTTETGMVKISPAEPVARTEKIKHSTSKEKSKLALMAAFVLLYNIKVIEIL